LNVSRILYLCEVAAAMATVAVGQSRLPEDSAFEKIPFEDWLKGGDQAHIQWSMRVGPAHLSERQRLEASVWVDVAAEEFVTRNRPGQVMAFLEIRDRDNHVYRIHRSLIRRKSSDAASVEWVQHVFLLPGDYDVAAAVYDEISKEHSLRRMTLRIPKLAHDPLPGAWRDMPIVDFSSQLVNNPPRLSLPLKTERPVRIEVIVNEAIYPSTMDRLTALLLSISQIEILNGSMRVTLLDLDHRKVSFTQEVVGNLDWQRLMAAMHRNNPNKVDAHVLENSKEETQFFVSEIRERLERTETEERERVIIVLSAPRRLPKEQDLQPVQSTPPPGSRVFYIRSYPLPYSPEELLPQYPVEPNLNDVHEGPANSQPASEVRLRLQRIEGSSDSLEPTLKRFAPRLFNVVTPEQFRSALAKILIEISQDKIKREPRP
jgi:hypothetical protein